jgi:adenine/guanine/hypoxanthine permease
MKKVNRAMMVDGFGLWLGGIIGSNSITCYIESNTGISAGARTGLASMVTGSAFLLSLLFVQPFVGIIPDPATTCALVMVGVFSLSGVKDINFDDFIDQMTAFMTIATMGFTYSIANGICAGFIWFTWMRTVRLVQFHVAKYFDKLDAWGPDPKLDSTPPHIIMYIASIFMVLRFRFFGL